MEGCIECFSWNFKFHTFLFLFFGFLFIGMVDFTRKTYAQTGWRTYRRPDEKSGGHGVGWSPIIPYAFSVPQDWQEVIIYNPNMFELHIEVVLFQTTLPLITSVYQVPVSIADLGGTEIDLRFGSSKEGRLSVIVAPVLRFADG